MGDGSGGGGRKGRSGGGGGGGSGVPATEGEAKEQLYAIGTALDAKYGVTTSKARSEESRQMHKDWVSRVSQSGMDTSNWKDDWLKGKYTRMKKRYG